MAFDRAAALRHAEKLLTRGKLDAAIAAYASVVRRAGLWLELQTDAGVHRDVAARIHRLARVKARG